MARPGGTGRDAARDHRATSTRRWSLRSTRRPVKAQAATALGIEPTPEHAGADGQLREERARTLGPRDPRRRHQARLRPGARPMNKTLLAIVRRPRVARASDDRQRGRRDDQARRLRDAACLREDRVRAVLRLRLFGGARPPVPDGDGAAQHAGPGGRSAGRKVLGVRPVDPQQLHARSHRAADRRAAAAPARRARRLCRRHERLARRGVSAAREVAAQSLQRRRLRARAMDRLRRGDGVRRHDGQPLLRRQHRGRQPGAAERADRQAWQGQRLADVRPAQVEGRSEGADHGAGRERFVRRGATSCRRAAGVCVAASRRRVAAEVAGGGAMLRSSVLHQTR